MISGARLRDNSRTRYEDAFNQCKKNLGSNGQPETFNRSIHSIRRRLSIGIPTKRSSGVYQTQTRNEKNESSSFRRCSDYTVRSPFARAHSFVSKETRLSEDKKSSINSKSYSANITDRNMSLAHHAKNFGATSKYTENSNPKYSTLAKTLSGIAQLSSRKEERMHRNTPLRSSLPLTNQRLNSECDSRQKKTKFSRIRALGKTLSQSSIFSSPDSGMASASSSESMNAKSFVSPTRYDALDDGSFLGDDSFFNCTQDSELKNESSSFYDFDDSAREKSEKTNSSKATMNVNALVQQTRGMKKATDKWRRTARDQMRMWSQRRNTLEVDDGVKRQQTMLRVSSSGRISLRQKNYNAENRLSLFGNPTESLLMLMQQPEMLQAFRNFLKSEYSEENLDFWLECEQYRILKPNRRKKMAAKIYATYLDAKAPREINIDAGTRARTEIHLENPKENTFEEAQKHIFDLMERDSFRRFITSDKHV